MVIENTPADDFLFCGGVATVTFGPPMLWAAAPPQNNQDFWGAPTYNHAAPTGLVLALSK